MSAPRQRPHVTSERQHDAYDEGWAAGRELVAASLADAFRAGAEYVRGVSFAMGWTNHPTTPPIVVAPTNEGITAAAEGYVSARRGGLVMMRHTLPALTMRMELERRVERPRLERPRLEPRPMPERWSLSAQGVSDVAVYENSGGGTYADILDRAEARTMARDLLALIDWLDHEERVLAQEGA